jgi:hypothetical protein
LFDEDDPGHDHQTERQDQEEDDPAVGAGARDFDTPECLREGGGDLGENHHRHAVADAPLSDQLTEPHDDAGAGGHGEDHHHHREDALVVHQPGTTNEELIVHRNRHKGRRVEDGQHESQVARVLGDLRLARLALFLERLQPRDDHREKLKNDARCDVGHDAQRKHRQMQEGAAGEQVDERIQALVGTGRGLLHAEVDLRHVHIRHRDDRAEPEDGEDAKSEEDLLPQIRSPECVGERGEHSCPPFLCDSLARPVDDMPSGTTRRRRTE